MGLSYVLDRTRYFALLSRKWQFLILKRQETWTEHVVIATSKCVSFGIFRRVQHLCQVSIVFPSLLAEIFLLFVCHHCTSQRVMSSVTKSAIIGKLEYLWNERRYHKKINAVLLYFKRPLKMGVFLKWLIFRVICTLTFFLFLYYIKQVHVDFMLLGVCLAIDHRKHQNVVRTSVTYSAITSHATFLLPHFDVICDLLQGF